jgi:NCS1 family nucleobase:cation symporter-1
MAVSRRQSTTLVPRSSLPLPLAQRTWGGFVLGAVCATAGVATWSFVVGGSAAYYLDARMGAAAMIAGGLIGQLLVTLATVPISTKHGIETVVSTKPQLGTRGSGIGLFMLYATALGWNTVLMIFFGRSAASVLEIFGVIDGSSRAVTSTVISVAGLLFVWLLVSRGTSSLSKTGPVIATAIVVLSAWLIFVVVREFGAAAIGSAEPLAPNPGRLLNYTTVVEMLIASTFGWWGYMGGIVRMASTARKALLPSMIGLGFAWVAVALVSLYGALITGEPDPTVWVPQITGDIGAVVVLVFIALSNLGSTLVGAFVATLAVQQMRVGGDRSWRTLSALVLVPMLLVLVFIPGPFFDRVGVFMAFIGMVIGPMVGVQIADWYILRRRSSLEVSSLYLSGPRSKYWYIKGFNPAGILALVLGSSTYLLILNPYTLVANSGVFQYITASLPAVTVGGVSYVLLTLLLGRRLVPPARAVGGTGPADEDRDPMATALDPVH